MARRLAAEGLGTALLLAAIVGSGIMAESLAKGNEALALLCNAAATGAMLIVLITMLAPISGAHLNPAVTLGFALRREIAPRSAALYITVQFAGAAFGTLIAHLMFGQHLLQVASLDRNAPSLWLSEAFATFGLVFAIFGARRVRPDTVALIVGLYIFSAYWFTASTSFANPAVTAARALTDTFTGIAPSGISAFMAAQIAGALLAVPLAAWLFEPVNAADRQPRSALGARDPGSR
jgi:glycerol uptake facilitator-like aquaporin